MKGSAKDQETEAAGDLAAALVQLSKDGQAISETCAAQ